MADTLSYAYQGEWSEALQTKLNQWFTKQSRFLKEMQFEEQLFRDFITVMVKDKQRSMGEIMNELVELSIESIQARELAEDLGRVLKSVENVNVPGMTRALQTSRGSSKPESSSSSDKPASSSGNVSRLLNSALQTSRGAADPPRPEQQKFEKNNNVSNKKREFGDEESGNKKPRHNNAGQQQHHDAHNIHKLPFPRRDNHTDPSPQPGTIEYFQKMNELAKQSGFQNAQEMITAQQQMMAMMHHPPVPPFPHAPMMPPAGFHDPGFMGPPVMMPPHMDPHRIDFYPQHFEHHHNGYGYNYDPRFQGRGYQGRSGRGSGRGGRGRTGGRGQETESKTEGGTPQTVDAPAVVQQQVPAVAAPASTEDMTTKETPKVSTSDQQSALQTATAPASTQSLQRGGRGDNNFGRGRGGKFQNAPGRGAPPTFVNSNPFLSQQNAAPAASQSESSTTTGETTPAAGGVFGRGVGGRGYSGRGRAQPAPAGGNKVWVRKTEQ